MDDYELGAKIGQGSFADVYHATHRLGGRHVALKIARDDDESRGRIAREIHVQSQLRLANVLAIIDSDPTEPRWFATEVAEGNLGQIHHEGRLGMADFLRMAEEILAALGAAHRREHFHRDLSPENILRLHGAWVLADWGYVSAPETGEGPKRMTRTGTAAGSFTWAAPEMFTDAHRADGRADLYALGKIIAWLVTGELPEVRRSPRVPSETPWSEFLSKVTSEEKEDRPATAEAALTLLAPVARDVASAPNEISTDTKTEATTLAARARVGALKRFLVNPAERIRLDDLIQSETARLVTVLNSSEFDFGTRLEHAGYKARLDRYANESAALMHLLFVGCYYGNADVREQWTRAVLRVASARKSGGGDTTLDEMRLASPLLVLYAGALGAVMGGSAANFTAVTLEPTVRWDNANEDFPLLFEVNIGAISFAEILHEPNARSRAITPGSDWLFQRLRPIAESNVVNDDEYETAFDQLELLLALIMADRDLGAVSGRFVWKQRHLYRPNIDIATTPLGRFAERLVGNDERWRSFGALLFDGDRARIMRSRDAVWALAQRRAH